MILEPALVGFGPEGSDQPEAARGGGKDPDHPRAPRDLLVAALTHVRALEMLVVVARQAGDVQGLADVRVDPVGALGVARRPAGEPRVEVLLGRLEVAPVVEPAPLLAAGKRRRAGDTARAATSSEVTDLRREARQLKDVVAEQALELRLLKKNMIADGGDEE